MSDPKGRRIPNAKPLAAPKFHPDALFADLLGRLDPAAAADEETRRLESRARTAAPPAEAFKATLREDARLREEETARLRALRLARDATARPER
ncbi:MAG: hypothetical protein ACOCTP_04310 [Roseicyclus sp.]